MHIFSYGARQIFGKPHTRTWSDPRGSWSIIVPICNMRTLLWGML